MKTNNAYKMVRLEGVAEFFNNTYLRYANICSPGRCATASADHI